MKAKYYPREFLRLVRRSIRSFFGEIFFGAGSPLGYALDLHQKKMQSFVLVWSVPILSDFPGVKLSHIKINSPYPVFNPSIERLLDGSGFVSLVRCTNIIKVNDGDSRVPEINSSEKHNTVNYLLKLNNNLNLESYCLIDDALIRKIAPNGLEDARLFWCDGRLMGVGAAIDKSGERGVKVSQVVFSLEDAVISEVYVAPRIYGKIEKNWVPLPSLNGGVTFVSSFVPLSFVDFNCKEFTVRKSVSPDFSVRGGTPIIPWSDGYLGIVHTPPLKFDGVVYYMHRFVLLDSSFLVRELSRPFFFQRRGIEFACGLVDAGEDLIVSYGVSDRSSHVMRISKITVQKLLGE